MARLKKAEREMLFERFEVIRDYPAKHRDFPHQEETGRDLDGHIAGRFAILFRDDFADRHVKIMGILWADHVT